MHRFRLGVVAAAAAMAVLQSGNAAAASSPLAPAAVKHLAEIQATKLSVDHDDNLWAWNAKTNTVTRFAPNGSVSESELPRCDNVDADGSYGIALLSDFGHQVDVYDWTGHLKWHVRLADAAADLCWIDANDIAVTPRYAPHVVEIVAVPSGNIIRSIGSSSEVMRTSGAVPAHATVVRYDSAHRELLTMRAFEGDFNAFSLDGKVVRSAHVENPRHAETLRWLDEMDKANRASKHSFTPLIWSYPTFTIADDGTVWMGETDDRRGDVTAVSIARDGTVRRSHLSSPDCSSIRFTSWHGYFVFFRDPVSPQPICVGVRRQ